MDKSENKAENNWLQERWYDFRIGHSTYLAFALNLINFLLISYTFLVSQIPFLQNIFPSLTHFAVIGVVVYVPLTTYVGYWHNCKQLETDLTVQAKKNPIYNEFIKQLADIHQELDKIKECLKE